MQQMQIEKYVTEIVNLNLAQLNIFLLIGMHQGTGHPPETWFSRLLRMKICIYEQNGIFFRIKTNLLSNLCIKNEKNTTKFFITNLIAPLN